MCKKPCGRSRTFEKEIRLADRLALFHFLIQIEEQLVIEKALNGNAKAITELLDGGNGGAVVAAADDVIDGGLGDTADVAQFIDGQILFLAQKQNTLPYSFADIH